MRKGFTLIELLVVVLIIGILAAIALSQYTKTVAKSRITENITLVKAGADSFERYFLQNNEYPPIPGIQSSDPSFLNAYLDINLPQKDGIKYQFSPAYLAIITQVKGVDVYITKTFRKGPWYNGDFTTCWTNETSLTNSAGQLLCKSLCGVSTLVKVWSSGQYGCLIGNPNYAGV